MKTTKANRILSMILALVMAMSVLPVNALAAVSSIATTKNLVVGILNDSSMAGEGQFPNEPNKASFDYYYLLLNSSGNYTLGTAWNSGRNFLTTDASKYIDLDAFWADSRITANASGNVAGIYSPTGLDLAGEPWLTGKTLLDQKQIIQLWMNATGASGTVDDYKLLAYVLKFEDTNYGTYMPDAYHLDMKVVKKTNVTLSYDVNKPVDASQDVVMPPNSSVTAGTQVTIANPTTKTITVSGNRYSFVEWNTKSDGSGTAYKNGDKITVTEDTTLYAQWRIANTYTITWRNHNNVALKLTANIPHSAKVSSYPYDGETPTKASDSTYSYTFTGWSGPVYDNGTAYNDSEGIQGNLTYTAQFTPQLIQHTATVEVVVNGKFDADDNRIGDGVNTDIEDVVSNARPNELYLAPADGGSYITLTRTTEGVYKSSAVPNGNYHIFLYDTAAGQYTQVGTQLLTMAGADRTRYLPYYTVEYADGAEPEVIPVEATKYYYNGSSAVVAAAISRTGYAFQGWSDGTATYAAGDTIGSITSGTVLTAQWKPLTDVYVNFHIDHISGGNHNNDNGKHNVSFTLDEREEGTSGDYTELYSTAISWNGSSAFGDVRFQAAIDTADGRDVTHYNAQTAIFQVLAENKEYTVTTAKSGYALDDRDRTGDSVGDPAIVVTETDGKITIDVYLVFDPNEYDLEFQVKLDSTSAALQDALKPAAVNIKIISWYDSPYVDGETVSWYPITTHKDTYLRVPVNADGTATISSFPVWTGTTDTHAPYHYRVEVVSYESAAGETIPAANRSNGHEYYDTVNGFYSTTVQVSGGGTPSGSSLAGAYYQHGAGGHEDGSQNGVITAVVSIHPYTVKLDPQGGELNGSGAVTTLANRYYVPTLTDYTPVRDGHTFGGWYTDADCTVSAISGAILSSLDTDKDKVVTLYAQWKPDFTVEGTVVVDLGFPCTDENRTVTVALQLKRGEGAYSVTEFSESISIRPVSGNPGYASGTYRFTNVPDAGEYRVYIIVPSGSTVAYQNEPASLNTANLYDANTYSTDGYTVVRGTTAPDIGTVNVYMDAIDFALGYMADTSAIGESFRPTGLTLDLRHDHRVDSTVSYETIRDDLKINSFVHGVSNIQTIPVPQYHANGYLYDYVVSVLRYSIARMGWNDRQYYHYESTSGYTPSPFAIRYTGPANYSTTANSDGLYQDVTLQAIFEPKQYSITYDLANGRWPAAVIDSVKDKHTWSYTTEIPQPIRDRYVFDGWTVTTASGADISAEVLAAGGNLPAAVWENVTFTANWKPEYIQIDPNGGIWNGSESKVDVQWDGIQPPEPSRAFYTFNGWTITEGGTALDGQKTIVYTYTANWVQPTNLTYVIHHKVRGTNAVLYEETITAASEGLMAGSTVNGAAKQRTFPGHTYDGAEPAQLTLSYDGSDYSMNVITLWYTRNSYTVTWKNEDGTVLETDTGVLYGTMPSYDGATPTKAADAQYTYTFDKWSPAVSAVNGDITYTATYTAAVNKYTVTWKNADGTVLETDTNVSYGAMPTYNSATPTKAADAQYIYTFDKWSPTVSTVTGNVTYTAAYTQTLRSYTVTWKNHDGHVLETDTSVPYGSIPAYNGAVPTRTGNAEHTYTFAGWDFDPQQHPVHGDMIFTAVYDTTVNAYTVLWENWDDTVLETDDHVHYGEMPVYNGTTPTRPQDQQYTYTFSGWTPSISPVTGNVSYQATFTPSLRSYTVIWKNADGTVLETDTGVAYGTTPTYNGTTPTKTATAQHTYTFNGWTPTIHGVTGDITYTATYTETVRTYTVTWVNWDGTVLETDLNVPYGATPTFDHSTVPTKLPDSQYTYTHSGWTPAVTTVTSDATYKAAFSTTVNKYTVIWENWDGEVLERDEQVEYGTMPSYSGSTPVRPESDGRTYTFEKWSPVIEQVKGNMTYTAMFQSSLNEYTILWENWDGEVLERDEPVTHRTTPSYDGATPTRPADAQYTYTFAGWDKEIVPAEGNTAYRAVFTPTVNKYTVTWKNWDGEVLETDENVKYGTEPEYNSAAPTRVPTAEFTYSFNGWVPTVSPVTGDVTYTASYTAAARTYTVIWKNWNGVVLEIDTHVPYGTTPTFNEETPVRLETEQYTYAFAGWDGDTSAPVSEDVTFTATYHQTVRTYTVTWEDHDGTVLETDSNVPYGTTPTYDGATPTRTGDAQHTHTFDRWSPTISPVTRDMIYTAMYTSSTNKYTVLWVNDDGTVLETDEDVEYDAAPDYNGSTPAKASTAQYTYTFTGWTPALKNVDGNATYMAVYSQTVNKYTVTWKNHDGSVLKTEELEYGAMPAYSGQTPTRPGDAQHTYVFAGWTPAISPVTSDASYTAEFTVTGNTYTVIWKNHDGTVLETDTNVPYGALPEYDGTLPVKAAEAQYVYVFDSWSPLPVTVTDNAIYTAQFRAAGKHTVSYEYTGTVPAGAPALPADSVYAVGEDVQVLSAPSFSGYTFSGWSADGIAVVNGYFQMTDRDVTFHGFWSQQQNQYTVHYQYEGEVPASAPAAPVDSVYTVGADVTVLDRPVLDGYTFSGWSTFDTAVVGSKFTMPSQNVTFRGSWAEASAPGSDPTPEPPAPPSPPVVVKYRVIYKYVGEVPEGAPAVPDTERYKTGVKVTVAGEPTMEGYIFSGWSTDRATVSDGQFKMPRKTVTLEGSWTKIPQAEEHHAYIVGFSDGTFRPTEGLTRGQAATILFRLMPDALREKYWSQTNDYTDCTPDLWCSNAISTMSNAGIFSGFEDGSFRPYGQITYTQFTGIAAAFFDFVIAESAAQNTTASDNASYRAYLDAAERIRQMIDLPDSSYLPGEPLSRAQACAIVNHILGRKPDAGHLLSQEEMILWPDVSADDPFYADIMEASNSHEYVWLDDSGSAEKWTAGLSRRDWAALEESGSTAHSAPGSNVIAGK